MEAFVMGYHVYKKTWKNLSLKIRYSHGAKQRNGQISCCYFSRTTETCCGSPALWTFWSIFYFLKADKENGCKLITHGKAVNQKDGLGMKVPSRLLFTGEEKFINILKEMLPKLL